MDVSTPIGGYSGFAPAAGNAQNADALDALIDRQLGGFDHTDPIGRRPIGSPCGDDTSDDATIARLQREVAAQQREIHELRHRHHADRDDDCDRRAEPLQKTLRPL